MTVIAKTRKHNIVEFDTTVQGYFAKCKQKMFIYYYFIKSISFHFVFVIFLNLLAELKTYLFFIIPPELV